MEIQIRQHDVEVTTLLRAHVKRRLGFALGRFATRIASVVVRFSDATGHRRGVDGRCEIDVNLYPTQTVRVDETDPDLFIATDRASSRISRVVARALERTRGHGCVEAGRRGARLGRSGARKLAA
jgi:ribosomal subunit interface protein